jgi:hypothetical protein
MQTYEAALRKALPPHQLYAVVIGIPDHITRKQEEEVNG